jgi:hypothetical protein
MTAFVAIPPSIPSGHLLFKGGDRFEFAAARLHKKSVYRSCAVDGDRRHSELPISHLEGEMPVKLTEGGENHRRQNGGGKTSVH